MKPVKYRVYEYLESVDRPVTIDEIAEETGVSPCTVKRVRREIAEAGGPLWKFGTPRCVNGTTCEDTILNYVRRSEKPVTYADIQQATGVNRNTISWVVGSLYGVGRLHKVLKTAEPGGGLRPHFYIER